MDLLCYEDIKYLFIEETNECNICYEYFFENFKCKRCCFICCPTCFYRFYFTDNDSDVLYKVFNVDTVPLIAIQNNIGLPDIFFLLSKFLSCVDVHKRTITVCPAILVIEGIHAISTIARAFRDKITLDKTPFKSNLIFIELITLDGPDV